MSIVMKAVAFLALLGLWSGPNPAVDWEPATREEGEWATVLLAAALMEGVRSDTLEVVEGALSGEIEEDEAGWRLWGNGMVLSSVADLLLVEIEGPARRWQPVLNRQYLQLRSIFQDQAEIDDPVGYLEAILTEAVFSGIGREMMGWGFHPLEVEQILATARRKFAEQTAGE